MDPKYNKENASTNHFQGAVGQSMQQIPEKTNTSPTPKLSLSQVLKLTKDEVKNSGTKQLVSYVLDLQNNYCRLSSEYEKLRGLATTTFAVEENDANRLEYLATRMAVTIMGMMKYSPACAKPGGVRWLYEGKVLVDDDFYQLFKLKKDILLDSSSWYITLTDFEKITGHLAVPIKNAYGHVLLRKGHVLIQWDKDEMAFTVSGCYGT